MKKVFVYGTLKKGGALHGNLAKSKFIGEAELSGFEMYNVGGWFPAIIKVDDKDSKVKGEVYEVDDTTATRLDSVEGYPDLYQKEETEHGIVYFMEDAEKVRKNHQRIDDNFWNVHKAD